MKEMCINIVCYVSAVPSASREVSTFKVSCGLDAVETALPLLADGALNIRFGMHFKNFVI